MAYLGYQTSDDEQTKLAVLWERFESLDLISLEEGIYVVHLFCILFVKKKM